MNSSMDSPTPNAFRNAWDAFPFKTIEDTLRQQLLEKGVKGPIVVLCTERGILETTGDTFTAHPESTIYSGVGDPEPPVKPHPRLRGGYI